MKNNMITEAALAQRKAYYKKYRAEHKDQIAKHQARYWEKQAEKARLNENAEVATAE